MRALALVWLVLSLLAGAYFLWEWLQQPLDVYVEMLGICMLSAVVAWLWAEAGKF